MSAIITASEYRYGITLRYLAAKDFANWVIPLLCFKKNDATASSVGKDQRMPEVGRMDGSR